MTDRIAGERWLLIPGHDGYEVSNLGRVRSLDRWVVGARGRDQRKRGRLLKLGLNKSGYFRTQLAYQKKFLVHHLVLLAFVGPRMNGLHGLHNNGNPQDNRSVNLRWGTPEDNMADKVLHGTNHELNKTHCPRNHPLTGDNLVPYQLQQGKRVCRACVKGRHHLEWCRRSGSIAPPLQEAADRFYAQICRGVLDERTNPAAYGNRLPPHLYRPA